MTTLAQQAWLDQDDQLTVDLVRRYGWRVVYVAAHGEDGDPCAPDCPCQDGPNEYGEIEDALPAPAFAYTVGLFGLGHPELLLFSTSAEVAGIVLNRLGARVLAGENLLPGRVIELSEWHRRMVTEQVPNPGGTVYAANAFYRRSAEASVPVLQLSYADDQGRFPWQGDYDHEAGWQPRPGTFWA